MDCPRCGSLNPDDAQWCSLCFARFDKEPEEDRQVVMPAVLPPDTPEVEGAWAAIAESPSAVSSAASQGGVASGPVRRRGEVTVWACPSCDTENSLDVDRCTVCGTSFFDAFMPPKDEEERVKARSPEVAAALSVLPGAGHAYLGRTAEAFARALIGLWWILTAWLIPGDDPALLAVKVMYVAASLALVGITAFDAYRSAASPGTPPLLSSRTFLYASLGMLVVLIAGGLVAAAAAT